MTLLGMLHRTRYMVFLRSRVFVHIQIMHDPAGEILLLYRNVQSRFATKLVDILERYETIALGEVKFSQRATKKLD